jgi:hypothetical protein
VTDDFQERLARAIAPYEDLLADFVAGRATVGDFQTRYLEAYLALDTDYDFEIFKVVDGFFAYVDSYVDDPALREAGDPTVADMNAHAAALLEQAGRA